MVSPIGVSAGAPGLCGPFVRYVATTATGAFIQMRAYCEPLRSVTGIVPASKMVTFQFAEWPRLPLQCIIAASGVPYPNHIMLTELQFSACYGVGENQISSKQFKICHRGHVRQFTAEPFD
jgi:hypothetical protein